jgi:predicted RNA-binding Zn-ribbon protein involved in translation (DUF1610 family)
VTTSATFSCAACGNVAATAALIDPGEPDPRLPPGSPDVPPGVGSILGSAFPDQARLSIDGGPVSVTHGFPPVERVAAALRAGDAAALFAIDPEYAPFWCPRCGASYCGYDYRSWVTFDEGFYDATYGVCPEGHERELDD